MNGSLDVPVPGPATAPSTYQFRPCSVRFTVTMTLAGRPDEGVSVAMYWKLSLVTSPACGV